MTLPDDATTIADNNSSRRLDAAQTAIATVRMMLRRPLSRAEAEAVFRDGYADAIDLIEAQITEAVAVYQQINEVSQS